MNCSIKQPEDGSEKVLNLLLKLEDRMNRQLSRKITENETPLELATDLVHHGLISEVRLHFLASCLKMLIWLTEQNSNICLDLPKRF